MSLEFIVEMAWKSALVAGLALLLAALLKSRSAADRAALLSLGAALVLLLPVVSLLLPSLQVEMAAGEARPLFADLPLADGAAAGPAMSAAWTAASSGGGAADDPTVLVLLLYLGGLAMAGFRLAAGLATLRRWTAAATPVSSPEWSQAFDRLGGGTLHRPVTLLVSAEAPAPLSWGWLRPVILIDPDSERRPQDAEAILAHELAHVLRRDWPALILARAAAALFWFNPLVWMVEREFVRNSEEAADCRAASQVEPASYARALLECACHSGTAPLAANSIASSDFARRVKAVLEGEGRRIPSGSRITLAAMLGSVALAAPVAALELVPQAEAAPAVLAAAAAQAAAVAPAAPGAVPQGPIGVAPLPPAPAAPDAPPPLPPLELEEALEPLARLPELGDQISRAVEASVAAKLRVAPALAPSERARAREQAAEGRRLGRLAFAEAGGAHKEAERAHRRAAQAHAQAARGLSQARHGMAAGADGMERGAEGMERGARHMAEEAVKLRDRDYRERKIAEQARRGETVTHEDLIDAIPKMEKGAREMLKGAEEMRRGAAQMRRAAER